MSLAFSNLISFIILNNSFVKVSSFRNVFLMSSILQKIPPPWIFRNSYGQAFLWSRQAQLIRLMWNGGCVIEPRKGSIEVGGSLWYNGLVFARCQAVFRSAAAAAVAAWCHCVFTWISTPLDFQEFRRPSIFVESSGSALSLEVEWRLCHKVCIQMNVPL